MRAPGVGKRVTPNRMYGRWNRHGMVSHGVGIKYWYLCRDLDLVAELAAIAAADAGLDSGTAAG